MVACTTIDNGQHNLEVSTMCRWHNHNFYIGRRDTAVSDHDRKVNSALETLYLYADAIRYLSIQELHLKISWSVLNS